MPDPATFVTRYTGRLTFAASPRRPSAHLSRGTMIGSLLPLFERLSFSGLPRRHRHAEIADNAHAAASGTS
jgi:hypothetical protein